MKIKLCLLVIAAVFRASSAEASEVRNGSSRVEPERAPRSGRGPASVIAPKLREFSASKEFWLNQQQAMLPRALCADGSYFRSCFETSEKTCLNASFEAAMACAAKMSLPERIRPRKDGDAYAFRLGACVGKKLEKSWAADKSGESRCSLAKNWL